MNQDFESPEVRPTVIAFIAPKQDGGLAVRYPRLFDALSSPRFAHYELNVERGVQTTEQALFVLSNEMPEPDTIALIDQESSYYDLKELVARCQFHFPMAQVVLLTPHSRAGFADTFRRLPELSYVLHEDHAVELTWFGHASGRPRLQTPTGQEVHFVENTSRTRTLSKLDEVVTSYTKRSVGGEFTEVRLNTPVAPKALPTGETVKDVLSRTRTRFARVLLVVPSQFNVYGVKIRPAYPALGVMWLAAMLEKAGHHAEIIDLDADKISLEEVLARITTEKHDIVGLTAVTSTYPNAVHIGKAVKQRFPQIKTVLGGIHATVDPLECAKEIAFDFVAVGEAECTVVELVDEIIHGRNGFLKVKGLVYRSENGELVSSGARPLVPELDDYPYPAIHLIKSLKNYAPADALNLPAAPIMVSRGCPGQCTYCQTKNIFGRRTRFRSPQNVIGEIRELVSRYGVKEIHFLDDVITANRKFVREFCELLKKEPYKLNIQVANGLRADMVNEEILGALKEVGLQNVGFGIETGSERVTKLIKKGITKDQVRKAISISKKLGLETWGFFIIGLPGDDESSVRETIDFAIELDPKYAKFLILKPFPGSEAYYQLDEKGLIDSRDYSQYGVYTPPVHHLESLSQDRILRLQKLAFRRFYLRPQKILQHLLDIRSLGKPPLPPSRDIFCIFQDIQTRIRWIGAKYRRVIGNFTVKETDL